MSHSRIDLNLPMEEVTFQMLHPSTEIGPQVRSYGLWHQKILLVDILGDIQSLNWSLVNEERSRNVVDQEVADIGERLQSWHESLACNMKMDNQNMDAYRMKGLGGTFVALHLGYHHYSTLLYFQYLQPTHEQSASAVIFAQRCKSHAVAFSKLLSCARGRNDCQVVYMTVAYMTMDSSSVLLHMLLFGSAEEVELGRTGLLTNFEALLELKRYWSCMDSVIWRLLTFQRACLRSDTYSIDRWLLRFLLEYGLPLTGKTTADDCVDSEAGTPNSHAPLHQSTALGQAFGELCS